MQQMAMLCTVLGDEAECEAKSSLLSLMVLMLECGDFSSSTFRNIKCCVPQTVNGLLLDDLSLFHPDRIFVVNYALNVKFIASVRY